MFRLFTCLLLFAHSSTKEARLPTHCELDRVEYCTVNLDAIGHEIAPLHQPDELESLCGKWSEARPCLDAVITACEAEKLNKTGDTNTVERIIVRKTVEQAATEWIMGYDYLCYDGKQGYSLVRDCMSKNNSLLAITDECYHNYRNHTWWLDPDEPINTHKFCKAARIFFGCMKKAGEHACGKAFSHWVWKFQEQIWSSHLYHIECLVGSKFSVGETAIVSMCAIAFGLCLIFTIASFIYKPKKKEKKKKPIKHTYSTISFGETNPSFVKETAGSSMAERGTTITRRSNAETKSVEITQI